MVSYFLTASLLLGAATAQSLDLTAPEVHPKITTYRCTKAGGCVAAQNAIVLDSASHWIRQTNDSSLGCGNWGSGPNATVCPDEASCAENCIMSGISDYAGAGVTTNGSSIRLDMLKDSDLSSLSPRVYLLAEDEQDYELLQLTGQEFTFDVDVSKLPCGMNGALYLSEMAADGGRSDLNPGGASYGTGYCDAQCFTTPWINGVGNIDALGACCSEMDIWEANARATQIAPHPCNHTGLYAASAAESAFNGTCDKNGCGNNPYVLGDPNYYGPGLEVDTTKIVTVVTQFPADAEGNLIGYKRLYVQGGEIIKSELNIPYFDSFNDTYCAASGATRYLDLGATEVMGGALSRGMVLALSVWWDTSGFMNWLDSGNAGPCNATEGNPTVIQAIEPDTDVTFSNIKWGEIDSTYTTNEMVASNATAPSYARALHRRQSL